MDMKYLVKFDTETGERLETHLSEDVSAEQAIQMLQEGFEFVSDEDFDKLIGNYDGRIYIKDINSGELIPKPPYTPPLKELKAQKLEAISKWTEKQITGGFMYNNVKYDSDLDTQITMQGIALNVHTDEFAEKYPQGCPVRGYDAGSREKTIHFLSADEVLGFCAALSIHIGTCKQLGWILQKRVAEAKNKEELAQVVWAE